LQAFRGIQLVTAVTIAAELGDLKRFAKPRQLMAYLGLVPTEHSSGQGRRRGAIGIDYFLLGAGGLGARSSTTVGVPIRTSALRRRRQARLFGA